jgi:RHS repeat-associated protein
VTVSDSYLTYDLRGKILQQLDNAGGKDSLVTRYSGLGQLRSQLQITHLRGADLPTSTYRTASTEQFSYDPLGNRHRADSESDTYKHWGTTSSTSHQSAAYERGTGRLLVGYHADTFVYGSTEYDEAGNVVFTTQLRPDTSERTKSDRASFYGADGQLRATDFRRGGSDTLSVFEEYRYDAVGRRVLVEARRACGYVADCSRSYVRRTVWAGAAELYEIQMPDDSVTKIPSGAVLRENDTEALPPFSAGYLGYDPNELFGRVAYTYGLTTDQPLSITRIAFADTAGAWRGPFTIVPHWTVRGYADTSYFAETGDARCTRTNRCVSLSYPADYWMPAYRFSQQSTGFHGSLLLDNTDASGQLYRRNRYYDASTGRFTQEDPIGLAGGLNLYGFAGGDPVNFSDPFGLWPDCTTLPCPLIAGGAAALGGPITAVGAAVLGVFVLDNAFGSRSGSAAFSERAGADATAYRPGGRFSPKTKREVEQAAREANGGALTCTYCGIELTDAPGSPTSKEHDHSIPKSKGGTNSPENDKLSCRTCNRQKGAKDPEDFRPERRPE